MANQELPSINGSQVDMRHPTSILFEFFTQHEPAFVRLTALRKKGWDDPRGDEHFRNQRSNADNTGNAGALRFYKMMQQIGDEMQDDTLALSHPFQSIESINILDLCMAPGGYTSSALKYNPGATSFGITLPPNQGGHVPLCPHSQANVRFLDITMLAKEFGVDEPPKTHPEHAKFLDERPFHGLLFQLVFCDGQVLRTHQRAEYREAHESRRLVVAQLILALQRIEDGGTLIMLLHKIEAWDTVELLYLFSQFSSIQGFKPKKKHGIRSSFYLIAKNIQPKSEAARMAVETWKRSWWLATFGGASGTGAYCELPDEEYVRTVLDRFGTELLDLARPIWETQAKALSKMDFVN